MCVVYDNILIAVLMMCELTLSTRVAQFAKANHNPGREIKMHDGN